MKLWKTQLKRTALALAAAAVLVPVAQSATRPDDRAVGPRSDVQQQPVRPDDRAGIRSVDGVTLGDAAGNVWGVASFSVLANEPALRPDNRAGVRGVGFATTAEDPYLRALRIRGEGMNKLYADQIPSLRPDDRAGVRGIDDPYLRAELIRGQGMNQLYGNYVPSQVTHTAVRPDDRAGFRGIDTSPIVVTQPSGFDWGDAGIGAVSAFGVACLFAGLMLLALQMHHRRERHVPAL